MEDKEKQDLEDKIEKLEKRISELETWKNNIEQPVFKLWE